MPSWRRSADTPMMSPDRRRDPVLLPLLADAFAGEPGFSSRFPNRTCPADIRLSSKVMRLASRSPFTAVVGARPSRGLSDKKAASGTRLPPPLALRDRSAVRPVDVPTAPTRRSSLHCPSMFGPLTFATRHTRVATYRPPAPTPSNGPRGLPQPRSMPISTTTPRGPLPRGRSRPSKITIGYR